MRGGYGRSCRVLADLLTILHAGHARLGLFLRFEGAHQFVLCCVRRGGHHFAFSAREVSGDIPPASVLDPGGTGAPAPANAYPTLSIIANAVKVVSFIGRTPYLLCGLSAREIKAGASIRARARW